MNTHTDITTATEAQTASTSLCVRSSGAISRRCESESRGRLRLASLWALGFVIAFGGWSSPAEAQVVSGVPHQLRGVDVDERLGDYVDDEAVFIDHEGNEVELGEFLGDKPVILTLNYYKCEMLCSLQLNGFVESLKGLEWTAGDEFRIVTVSIDPREGKSLARSNRIGYLDKLGRGGDIDWNFLVGDEAMIRRVADSVGFGYSYDANQDQYAHVAVLMFLSPDGKITRYLYGLEFRPFDMKMAIQEASDGEVGDPLERVIFSCFHYDPESGGYTLWAMGLMRVAGVVTVVLLAVFLTFMFVWERLRRRREQPAHQVE